MIPITHSPPTLCAQQPPQSNSERERHGAASSESYQRSRNAYPPPRGSSYHHNSESSHLSEDPGHSYHLFNLIPEQGLVHQRSSSRDDLDPTIPKPRLPPSDPARKYACAECGNRFSKQSTLRVSFFITLCPNGKGFSNYGFFCLLRTTY